MKLKFFGFLILVLFIGCKSSVISEKQPNILWIVLEDTAPIFGCYGSELVHTPHVDSLAARGMLFRNVIMPAPVCSPCRSSIITGTMSTSLGLHNHHSSRTPESAIHLPEGYQTVPQLFREAGYFTFNNGKDDYNFSYDRRALYQQDYQQHPLYGKRGIPIPLSSLVNKLPFFGQIQLSGGKEIFSKQFRDNVENPIDRSKIVLPPYLPRDSVIIEEYANHLDAINLTDKRVGTILSELAENNLLQNTIVFFFSDHGMRMIRNKQFLYEGGLKVPLVITNFGADLDLRSGAENDHLISGIDLGTTALSLAGIEIPSYMEGINFLAPDFSGRDYVVSTRDRCDFTIDRIRSVRTMRYKYIRNFLTDRPYTQPTYMDVDQVPFVTRMKKLAAESKLDSVQARFMGTFRPDDELYDLQNDPFELQNLAREKAFAPVLSTHQNLLEKWIEDSDDQGQYPEDEENLKLILGIWGDHAINPEFDELRKKYPDLAGSQFALKSAGFQDHIE